MPLEPGKSKAAFSHNVKVEMAAHKPQKQAVAIAYREAGKDSPKAELSAAVAAGESEAAHQKAALAEMDAAAGMMLMSPKDTMLFLKRSPKARDHQGEWCCPGGDVEEGETPEQAAHRELQEETQYGGRISGASPIDERDGFTTFCGKVDDEFTPSLNHEHTDFVWANPNSPPQPLHPGVAATLKKMSAKDAAPFAQEGFKANVKHLAELKSTERHNATHSILANAEDLPAGALDLREYDDNGWYTVMDNPLSKAGVYTYSEASIVKGGDRTKRVGVLRAPEELNNEETIKSFRLLPWTDDHPTALLGAREQGLIPAEAKGVHGTIGEDVYFKDDTLYGNVKVWSEALARSISSGKRELSCGYQCDFVRQDGVYNGQPYQYVQKNIRGNHVASVDKGRMGSDVRVMDAAEKFTFSLDMKESDMAAKDEKNGLVKQIGDKEPTETEMKAKDAGGEVKDPEGKAESGGEKEDLKPKGEKGGSTDKKVKDESEEKEKEKAKDENEEEEEGEDEDEDKKKEEMKAKSKDKAKDKAKDKEMEMAKGKGMDAAEVAALVDQRVAGIVPAMRREAAAKLKLYGRLSPIIGAFDHDEMSLSDMAAYGLKKVGAADAKDPVTALDYYLVGRGNAVQVERTVRTAHDAVDENSFMGRYLKSA